MVPTWSKRKTLVMGLGTIAAGLAIGREALIARRTGAPLVSVNRSLPTDWWIWLGVAVLAVAFGLCVVAVVAVSVFIVIFTHLWYAWGVFGALLALGAGLLAFGWAFDRRERKRRERLAA